jgi:acetyl esterase/lipase
MVESSVGQEAMVKWAAMPIQFDENDLTETRRVNKQLARMPRVTMHGFQRTIMKGLMDFVGLFATPFLQYGGVNIEDRVVSASGRSVSIQVIRPRGPIRGVHIDIHGGGWTVGRAYFNAELNAAIARHCGVAVVAVDYRLAPEVPFTTVLDDCETAARWLLDEGLREFGVDCVTIGGDSAGAHLAASTMLRLRGGRHFHKLKGAALVYGCFDLGGTPSIYTAGPHTLLLHGPSLAKIIDIVTGGLSVEARRDPALSPLYADLRGLPPALFVVGTSDPLLDDSTLMHAKWAESSGEAELVLVPEAPHGFNRFESSTARKTNAYIRQWIGDYLDKALSSPAAP